MKYLLDWKIGAILAIALFGVRAMFKDQSYPAWVCLLPLVIPAIAIIGNLITKSK